MNIDNADSRKETQSLVTRLRRLKRSSWFGLYSVRVLLLMAKSFGQTR